jgi:hypothetical protein
MKTPRRSSFAKSKRFYNFGSYDMDPILGPVRRGLEYAKVYYTYKLSHRNWVSVVTNSSNNRNTKI